MILNAVALFFLMELDNVIVTDEDYKVCGKQLKKIDRKYKQLKKNHLDMNDDNDEEVVNDSRSKCCREVCGWITYHFHFLVKFGCLVCGVFAPFFIFMCW